VRLLDELRAEHDLIDPVLGALRTYVDRRVGGDAGPGDAPAFLRFFRLYAGHFHHAREEEVLVPALVGDAELPRDRGPIPSLLQQHRDMAGVLAEVEALLPAPSLSPDQGRALADAAVRYSHALWRHIDAENSVLLPESEARLRRVGRLELEGRPASPEEEAARDEGRRLLALYPPVHDRVALRGEGCVVCPSHGVTCDGVEREWWTDAEWGDFFDRVG
jgi:hemerythrin-like domain-containing protein